jgi:hypothetical protein
MQALKTLVIFMGVLIVLGVALLVYGLSTRLSDGSDAGGFGEVALPLPAGCVLAEARAAGERLIVRSDGPAERGCQQVFVVDLASGRLLGRVGAAAAP